MVLRRVKSEKGHNFYKNHQNCLIDIFIKVKRLPRDSALCLQTNLYTSLVQFFFRLAVLTPFGRKSIKTEGKGNSGIGFY